MSSHLLGPLVLPGPYIYVTAFPSFLRKKLHIGPPERMPKHENLEAYIMCDGERLEEYDVQTDGNVVTCWVESKLDKVCAHFYMCSYKVSFTALSFLHVVF